MAKTLWFKQRFVEDILAGKKRDTMRPVSKRRFMVGDVCSLSVGPRAPFASARITKVEVIKLASLPAWRREQVLACYKAPPAEMMRLCFRVLSEDDRRD